MRYIFTVMVYLLITLWLVILCLSSKQYLPKTGEFIAGVGLVYC